MTTKRNGPARLGHKQAPTIGLAMIVKNEEHVLARCLESVKPLIAYWTIVDTGSTDDTEAVARKALDGIPGDFVRRPWVDFAHNRTESLRLARDKADYTLVMDADDILVRNEDEPPLQVLNKDVYLLRVDHHGIIHKRAQMVSNRLDWRYEGRVHEYLATDEVASTGLFRGWTYTVVGGGGRSQTPGSKYLRDAEVLEQAVKDEPNRTRNWFYLAQSYRDAGVHDKALEIYKKRASMGGSTEEVFLSLLQIGALSVKLGRPEAEVAEAYLAAYSARPTRAEPLCYLAQFYRKRGSFALAYVYATAAAGLDLPNDKLLVDVAVYDWKALDEKASAAFRLEHYKEALVCNELLLKRPKLPDKQRQRIQTNVDVCHTRMKTKKAS